MIALDSHPIIDGDSTGVTFSQNLWASDGETKFLWTQRNDLFYFSDDHNWRKFSFIDCLAVMEPRDLVSVLRHVSRPVFRVSVSKVSGLVYVSASKDFGLGLDLDLLVSRLCMSFFYEVLQEAAP